MKLVKQVVAIIIITALVIAGLILFIAYKFEDELKQNAIKAINKQLATEISVESVSVDAFKKFPFISIKMDNALAKDALIKVNNKDTLFYFKQAYLQFNIIDILNETYNLREISLENGIINLRTDKKGENNYTIFNDTESDENDNQNITLEKVYLNNVVINYDNHQLKNKFTLKANKTYIKGEFNKEVYDLDIYGKLQIRYINLADDRYFENKTIKADVRIYIDNDSNNYKFTRGNLLVDESLNFIVTGSIKSNEELFYDLKISGLELDIKESASLLPNYVSNYLNSYSSDGNLNFISTIYGELSKTKKPEINADFTIKNGTLKENNYNLLIQQLSLQGNFNSNGVFKLTDISAKVNNGGFAGNFSVNNFDTPKVDMNFQASLGAEEIISIFKVDTIQHINGNITIVANISGVIKNPNKISFNDFDRIQSSGQLNLSEINFSLKNDANQHANINGVLNFKGNDLLIETFSGKINSTDYALKGAFENAISFLFIPEQKLGVVATLKSDFVDMNEFMSDDNNANNDYHLVIPDYLTLDINASIDSLIFRKFYATAIKTDISMKNQQIILHPFSMNCVGGTVQGDAFLSAANSEKIKIKTVCELQKINVSTLFNQFENFNQSTLTEEHLHGIADAKIEYAMQMDSILNVDQQSIISNIKINIENGELINFKPLIESADYIKTNKIISAFVKHEEFSGRLKHIKFKTLSNNINIENRTITIPKMNIQSSAMDIELDGVHSFDNEINYNLNFYLSDLLTTSEAERNEKGKTKIYLHMYGTIDNPIIEYNKSAAKAGIKHEVKSEQTEVKSILKEELGLFGKDTSVKSTYTPPEKLDFNIEWEENPEQEKIKSEPTDKDKKGIKSLFKEDDKKTNTEDFDFDDGDF